MTDTPRGTGLGRYLQGVQHVGITVYDMKKSIESGYSEFKFHQALTRVPAGRLVKVIYNKGIIQITEGI